MYDYVKLHNTAYMMSCRPRRNTRGPNVNYFRTYKQLTKLMDQQKAKDTAQPSALSRLIQYPPFLSLSSPVCPYASSITFERWYSDRTSSKGCCKLSSAKDLSNDPS